MRSYRRFLPLLVPLCIFALSNGDSQIPRKRILLVKFQDLLSSRFRDTLNPGFAISVPQFTSDFAHQLQLSKAIDVETELHDWDYLEGTLKAGYGKDYQRSLDSLVRKFPHYDYYITGRLRDEGDGLVEVDGECFKPDSVRSALRLAFTLTAYGAKSTFEKIYGTNLREALIDQLVQEVEGNLDEKIRVVVEPFSFYGSDTSERFIALTVPSQIRTRLSTSHRVRVVLPEDSLYLNWDPTVFRKSTVPERRRREAAKYVITGSCSKYGDALIVEVSHIDAETGHVVLSSSQFIDSLRGRLFYDRVDALGDELRQAIEADYESKIDLTKRSIAIVAVPPFPDNSYNRSIALQIVRTVIRKVRILSTRYPQIEVKDNEDLLEKFVVGTSDRASIGREFNAQYLLIVQCDRPLPEFFVTFELFNVTDPNIHSKLFSESLKSIDELPNAVDTLTSHFLGRWLPDSLVKPMNTELSDIQYSDETWGIRARTKLIGITRDTRSIFLGDHLRSGYELSLILFGSPFQYELSYTYDLGKVNFGKEVFGRYGSFVVRYSHNLSQIRDARWYIGAGPAAINIVQLYNGETHGNVYFGIDVCTGAEVLIWHKMYIDLSLEYLQRLPVVNTGGLDLSGASGTGNFLNFELGLGLGYRF